MSASFARLRGALDRVGTTTTPGTIVGVFAEDLTAIMDHYVEVVREAAELKAAHAQPAQAVPLLTDAEIEPLAVAHEDFGFGRVDSHGLTTHGFDPDGLRSFVNAIEHAVRAKLLGKEGA